MKALESTKQCLEGVVSWLWLSKAQTSSQAKKNAETNGLLKIPATLQFILTVSKFAELL